MVVAGARWGLLPALLVMTFALSGCMMASNSVNIAGQGYSSGTQTKTLSCQTSAQLALGAQGGGTLTVKVTDGGGQQVFSQSIGSGQDGTAQTLTGKAGTWTLSVSMGFGYGGQYAISLSC